MGRLARRGPPTARRVEVLGGRGPPPVSVAPHPCPCPQEPWLPAPCWVLPLSCASRCPGPAAWCGFDVRCRWRFWNPKGGTALTSGREALVPPAECTPSSRLELPPRSRSSVTCTQDGGWTVIQSRDWGRGRPLDFERCWQEYKQGFGDLRGDHWLGLQHISDLTSQPGLRAELRVDLLDVDNRTLHAHYNHFHVDGEAQFYRLTLGLYSGNAGDAFRGSGHTDNQEGCGFSTLDRDHDRCSPCTDGAQTFSSCSHDRSGSGWWYSDCGHADLNGPWPEREGAISGMRWAAGDQQPTLSSSVLRLRTTAPREA
ncbi:angiopoietin-related protein 5-like [Canis lupus dingo]|uniref:angiopoietin-related protein 5-like n=1 Tax=Canis lupus dingo TaxID=286419 RepID=UPI0020C317C8|nr:angiopoietin-related protein 5-like [Canis lupus dingo]